MLFRTRLVFLHKSDSPGQAKHTVTLSKLTLSKQTLGLNIAGDIYENQSTQLLT